MFEQSFVSSGQPRRPWTVVAALAGQLAAIGLLLAIPLLFVESLPVTQFTSVLLAPSPPPPPPPPPPAPAQVRVARETHKTTPRMFDMRRLIAPTTIPKQIATVKDLQELPPPSVGGVIGGVPDGLTAGVPGGIVGGILGGISNAPPPPPPPKAEAPQPVTPTRIRLGGNVEAARLIHQVQPEYPLLARDARIGGVVVLKAIINRDGSVENLSLVSGQPLLVAAAMDAVKQWVYKPTYLNGVPVEVVTEVDVDFRLSS
jgi:protein TonB